MALTEREHLFLENAIALIGLAEAAAEALRYSFAHRPELTLERDASRTDAEWERWDALTVRFARLADVLTQQVFRAIDMAEFLPGDSTFVDRINRAEKRGHIKSAYVWKEIRDIRNQIVHEYTSAQLRLLFQDVVRHAPELLACVERLSSYKAALMQQLANDPA